MVKLPEIISGKLGALRRRIRTVVFIEGASYVLLVLLAVIVVTFLFDYSTPLPFGMRLFLDIVAIILLLLAARKWFIIPLMRRLDHDLLALMVEREYAGSRHSFHDSLISAVQFARDRQGEFEFNSPALVAKVVYNTAIRSRGVSFNSAVRPGRAFLYAILVLLGIAAVGAYARVFPENAKIWFQRLVLLHNIEWPKVNMLELVNKPEELTVARGELLDIKFRSIGKRRPRHVTLTAWFVDSAGNPLGGRMREESFEMEAHGASIFSRTFDPVTASFKFNVEGGDFESKDHMVRVLVRPHIESMVCEIEYPKYVIESGFPEPRTHYTGNLREPEGSLVRFKAYTSKPIKFAGFVGLTPEPPTPETFTGENLGMATEIPISEKQPPKPFTEDFPEGTGNLIEGAFRVPARTVRYRLILRDNENFESKSTFFQVIPIPDTPPRVMVILPGRNIDATPTAEVPMSVEVKDNYGVKTVRCIAYMRRETEANIETTKPKQVDWGNVSGLGSKTVTHAFRWDLSALDVKAGDTIFYQIIAEDGKEIGGPGIGKSDELKIRIVSPEDLKHTYAQVIDRIKDNLRRTMEFQRRTRDSLGEVADRLASEERFDREMKSELARIKADQQDRIGRPISNLREDFRRVMHTMRDNKIIMPDTFADFSVILEMIKDLSENTIPDITRNLDSAKEKSVSENPESDIAQALAGQETVIDTIQDIVDRLTDWSDINDIIREIERIKEKQKIIKKGTEELLKGEPR